MTHTPAEIVKTCANGGRKPPNAKEILDKRRNNDDIFVKVWCPKCGKGQVLVELAPHSRARSKCKACNHYYIATVSTRGKVRVQHTVKNEGP